MSETFFITDGAQDGFTVLSLTGRLGADAATDLRETCMDRIEAGERTLVLDLRAVPFVASSGLGTFLYVNEMMKELGGRMVLAGVQPLVQDVLSLMNIDRFLNIVEDVDQVRRELTPAT